MAKPNVEVITSPIKSVTKDKLVNEDGTTAKPDVLILATGFKVQDFFAPLEIKGTRGADLLQKWKKSGPSAYGGIACNELPNAFFLLGPNTVIIQLMIQLRIIFWIYKIKSSICDKVNLIFL